MHEGQKWETSGSARGVPLKLDWEQCPKWRIRLAVETARG